MFLYNFPGFFGGGEGVRSGAVSCGTTLQDGRSRVRLRMLSLEFFIDISPGGRGPVWGWLSRRWEGGPGGVLAGAGGLKAAGA